MQGAVGAAVISAHLRSGRRLGRSVGQCGSCAPCFLRASSHAPSSASVAPPSCGMHAVCGAKGRGRARGPGDGPGWGCAHRLLHKRFADRLGRIGTQPQTSRMGCCWGAISRGTACQRPGPETLAGCSIAQQGQPCSRRLRRCDVAGGRSQAGPRVSYTDPEKTCGVGCSAPADVAVHLMFRRGFGQVAMALAPGPSRYVARLVGYRDDGT
jgi:hypothetical protein